MDKNAQTNQKLRLYEISLVILHSFCELYLLCVDPFKINKMGHYLIFGYR